MACKDVKLMPSNLISVVVPVYNLENELSRCLESILAQTYTDIEIIVVDDGSKDRSADVMRHYAELDGRVKLIFQANGGVTSARLRGVEEALGDWIGFVDGDDEIAPDMYERLLRNALKYDAEISHCGYQMIFTDGRVSYFHNTGYFAKQDKITALRELLSGSRIEPGLCNKLFRKNLLHSLLHDKVMPMDIKINEDLLMNYYLFSRAEQTVFDDWCPYHYVVRSTSVSRVKLNHHQIYDPIRVKGIIRQTAIEDIRADAQKAYVNTCINICHTLMNAGADYQEEEKNIRTLLSEERKTFYVLGKKRAIMAWMIVNISVVYKAIYSVYCRFFQKRIYS